MADFQLIHHARCELTGEHNCLKAPLVHQTENYRTKIQIITEWLFFLYPVSLAINKAMHEVVTVLIFFGACFCLVIHARDLKFGLTGTRWLWIAALCMPLLLTAIQYVSLFPQLGLQDFDNISRFSLCIPVYLALLIIRPNIRLFLWGCVFFTLYSVVLMFWHMHVQGLDRGIAPNGFLGIIPHTSLSIILAMLALRLKTGTDGSFQRRLLPVLLMCCTFIVPLLTETRSGLLLALAMSVLVWFLLADKNIKILLFGSVVAVGVMTMVLSNSNLWSRSDSTMAEIAQYTTQDPPVMTSATIRIELWRYATSVFVGHPLIGVGNHRFQGTLSDYKLPVGLDLYTHPHNEFLRVAAEGGLLGILGLAMLYFVPMVVAWRSYLRSRSATNPALMIIIFSCGFLIAGLVDVVLVWRPTIMFYGMIISLLLVDMDKNYRAEKN
jgi:O-antigen ligase